MTKSLATMPESLLQLDSPKTPTSIFFSGHSLLDHPMVGYVSLISESLGSPIEWNRQNIGGSGIDRRTRGEDRLQSDWKGYREGQNKNGEGLNVLSELKSPETISQEKYDALIVTEWDRALDAILWNDTVRYLRHMHDRLVESNSEGVTYFYESWHGVSSKSDPAEWIEYERAMSPVWQCVATRINVSLAAEGRSDHVRSIPAASALAYLIESASAKSELVFWGVKDIGDVVNLFVHDDVHTTDLGGYYLALIVYAQIFERSPQGAAAPDGVTVKQADYLQRLAWKFTQERVGVRSPKTLGECRDYISAGVLARYWRYQWRSVWRRDIGLIHGIVRGVKYFTLSWLVLRRKDVSNPFHFDAAADQKYWFPAPRSVDVDFGGTTPM